MFGTLGGVHQELREGIMTEAVRVLKPAGRVYVAELARKHDGQEREKRYMEDAQITGEIGSRIVYDHRTKDVLFVAKHFEEYELYDLMQRHGLVDIRIEKHHIEKQALGSGAAEQREQLSVWCQKP